jgi:hypothetical protein
MELSPKTKVNDLLNLYPFLKDFLVNLNPEFKMLDNPFMRKTVGRIASLGKVAMIGGMDVSLLMNSAGKKKTGGCDAYSEAGVTSRKAAETLKNHQGTHEATPTCKKKFEELIKDVAPWDRPDGTTTYCRGHAGDGDQALRGACSGSRGVGHHRARLPAGHPVHTLMLENRVAEGI